MSQEDLENMGILLPREEWGRYQLATAVNKPLLAVIGILTVLSVMFIYFGNGKSLTWVGTGLFLIMLLLFTWLSIRAVNNQVNFFEESTNEELT